MHQIQSVCLVAETCLELGYSLALAGIRSSLRGLNVEIVWTDQLEPRIILCRNLAFLVEMVEIYQLGDEDLDFQQSEVEANAHSLSHGEAVDG